LYKLVPLPSSSNQSNIFSYIDPPNPYLLLNVTRVRYGQLRDLSSCTKLPESTFMCSVPVIFLSSQRPICEVRLRTEDLKDIRVPSDCNTKSVKASMEIWHNLNPNQWIYVVSRPVHATISCQPNTENIIDVTQKRVGIFELQPKCRCYTMTTTLVASSNITRNFTNYIPKININHDNCCIEKEDLLESTQMRPLQFDNSDLDALRHAKHKLQQFDEILAKEVNKPFLAEHHSIFGLLIGILTVSTIIIIICCCCSRYCCDCTWIPYFGKFLPSKSGSLIEYCRNSKNQIRNSVVMIPHPISMADLREISTDETNIFSASDAVNRLLHPVTENNTVTRTEEERPPVVSNPYNLRPRNSTSREKLS
jgi:hypothetical protein